MNPDNPVAMIPRTSPPVQTPVWQRELARAIRDPRELLEVLALDPGWLPAARNAARLFPLRVPQAYVSRMQRGDITDPLLRQVLPLAQEFEQADGYSTDPVGDLAAVAAPGVLHKYHGRVLVVTTGACAIHCRYCFRRHFPYGDTQAASDHWSGLLHYLRAHLEVNEVLLSGGDPLMLSDARLADLAQRIAGIANIKRLRLHTRLPVVLPARVDDRLLHWLAACKLQVVIVLHVNHANEMDIEVQEACRKLAAAGVTLLNQSVLLREVNADVDTLAALSERLMECGVLPYYLHLLDRVQGAAHFDIEEARARQLYATLQDRLPGYLVPRLVREEAGAAAKTPVMP